MPVISAGGLQQGAQTCLGSVYEVFERLVLAVPCLDVDATSPGELLGARRPSTGIVREDLRRGDASCYFGARTTDEAKADVPCRQPHVQGRLGRAVLVQRSANLVREPLVMGRDSNREDGIDQLCDGVAYRAGFKEE